MTPRAIRFVHQGRIVEIDDAEPTRTVLQWLREDARCTGTKEGCAEGDCGACTVLVAELADTEPHDFAERLGNEQASVRVAQGDIVVDGVSVRAVNACIRFLPTLDGKALLSVEDLTSVTAEGETLHPAQRAMVECHGSQCGFCTPGFVMSLAATHERHCTVGTVPGRAELADDLAGNLCRCTGYRPILDAGERMFSLPHQTRLPLAGLKPLLEQLSKDLPLRYSRRAATVAATGAQTGAQRLDAHPAPHRFEAPQSLASLAALRLQRPEARLLAGATDVGLWVTKQFRALDDLIWLDRVPELHRIHTTDTLVRIAAAVPLADAWAEIVRHWPTCADMARRFAGPPVRNAGTLVGNLANGSPIGDSAPVLMALDASLVLRRGDAQRKMPLASFYTGYQKNALRTGEFIEAVDIPLPAALPGRQLRAYKQSKRFDSDISAVSAGFAIELNIDRRVTGVRLAFGGMAATVMRAASAEAVLQGQVWDEASLAAATRALADDFQPLTDLRASAEYRKLIAGRLLRRFWLATRGNDAVEDRLLDVYDPVHATLHDSPEGALR